MACTHDRIKSVNCVIMCADCGAHLPIDYLVGKQKISEQAQEAQKQPELPPDDVQTDEHPTEQAEAGKIAENAPENATPEEAKPETVEEAKPAKAKPGRKPAKK